MTINKSTLSRVGVGVLFAGVIGLMAVNGVLLYKSKMKVTAEAKAAEEAAKPANLELTVLTAPDCTECYNVNELTGPLKSNPKVKIIKEDLVIYSSEAGAAIIKQYGITKVPTVIVKGQVDKVFDADSFVKSMGKKGEDGALVVTNVPAPYLDLATGKVHGQFTLTILTDTSCKTCYDPTLHRRALEQFKMKATKESIVDRTSAEGQRLIAAYHIDSVPTILLSGDLEAYGNFVKVWPLVGTVEKDGTHIFRAGQKLMGSYHDLKTGKVVAPPPPSAADAGGGAPSATAPSAQAHH